MLSYQPPTDPPHEHHHQHTLTQTSPQTTVYLLITTSCFVLMLVLLTWLPPLPLSRHTRRRARRPCSPRCRLVGRIPPALRRRPAPLLLRACRWWRPRRAAGPWRRWPTRRRLDRAAARWRRLATLGRSLARALVSAMAFAFPFMSHRFAGRALHHCYVFPPGHAYQPRSLRRRRPRHRGLVLEAKEGSEATEPRCCLLRDDW